MASTSGKTNRQWVLRQRPKGLIQPGDLELIETAEQMAKGYPLHWIDKATGEHRFAWSVWHPGTFPDPFVERAMDAMSPQLAMGVGRVARRVAWLS